MPLPIAHGLAGASIIALVHPKGDVKNWKPLLLGFVLANCPDLDLGFQFLFGGRGFHRGFTHSIFFAFLVGVAIFVWFRREHWRIPLAYSSAFLSHTILDFVSANSGAVRILMPFSNKPYGLGAISFSELSRGFLISDMLYFSAIEALIFIPLFLIALFVRRFI